ncbi:MAG TPA: alpha/beta fold hydrolase [Agromyces sp.]|nr:alpha/beta fold hydrolase [Agromyces sp.]
MPYSKLAAWALVAVTATLLSGCAGAGPNGGESGASGEPAASADYEATYETSVCPVPNMPGHPTHDLGPEYECGYLTVPENRSDPDGATIRLAVARVPAISATPADTPLVYLDGGPGGTALVSAPAQVATGINAERDVIFIDQRGTLHSEPNLTCPEIDDFLAEAPQLSFTDASTDALSNAATTACHDRLVTAGIDLASYNTAENAHDIADLRVALGIDEWDVYGVSYGTDLALTVLRDHPEGIRSVVLDSVVPPNLNIIPEFWPTAAVAYQALFDACDAQPVCAAAYPDLAREFTETVARLTETPLTVQVADASGAPVDVVIDGYQLANTTAILLASGPAGWKAAPGMIHRLAQGDGTTAATLQRSIVPPPDLVGLGLQWGVFCQEYVAQTDLDEVLERGREVLPGFPDDTLRFLPQIPWAFDDCAIWDVGEADAATRAPVESDLPVLVMGGTFDAVTAVSWGDALVGGLTNAQFVAFPGLGHQVLPQSPCPVTVMRDFLADPDAAIDDSCVGEMTLPTIVTP